MKTFLSTMIIQLVGNSYIIVKTPLHVCMENTAQGNCIESFIQHDVLAECCMIPETPTQVLYFG